MNRVSLVLAFLVGCLAASTSVADSPIQAGDRIAIVGNTFADQMRIHGYLERLLLRSSAKTPVSIRNLGWAGDMLTARDRPTNFPTEESTLTAHKTDVIIACFGLGESFGGQKRLGEFQAALQTFIASHAGRKYNAKSVVRLVFVSPIAYEDLGELTPHRAQRNRDLQAYTTAMKEVAAKAQVPFVDLFAPTLYLMNEPEGPNLTSNGIHLNQFGYWAIAKEFFNQLTTEEQRFHHGGWQLAVDVQSRKSAATGVETSELAFSENGVSFLVTETSVPRLPPPTDLSLLEQLESNRDTLRVENLKPGTYQLTVDDQPVAVATAKAWGKGVPIDASPAHQDAETHRAAINDKNLQFTYSWKALNQVHIVGERRSSPSGRALPQEVIEFNKLANQRDDALRSRIERKTRRWRLMSVGK